MAWSYTALTDRSVAKFAEIISDNGFVFINGNASSSKTLNIVASGFTPTSYKWYKKNSNGTYDEITGATNATYVVQGVSNIGTYRGSAFDGNEELSDYVTIDAVSDGTSGSSPYLFSVSNENFSISTDNSLKPTSALNYDITITGYHGSALMTPVAPSATLASGQYKVACSSNLFALQNDNKTLRFTTDTATALASANQSFTVTVSYYNDSTSSVQTEEKIITVSASKNGVDGVSPTATVSRSGSTTTITITDKSGTTSETVSDGANGVSVSSVTEYYQRTNSATAPAKPASSSSLGSWKTTVDNPISTAQYLYNCEIIKFSNNTETVTNPVQIAKYVTNGANGKGIASIQNVYKLTTNTTAPTAPSATDAVWTGSATGSTSAWGTVCPTTTTTNKYLWNVERVTYDSNPATYSISSVKLISTHGATGTAASQIGDNLLKNSDFRNGITGYTGDTATFTFGTDTLYGNIMKVKVSGSKRFYQNISGLFENGKTYAYSFYAKADASVTIRPSRALVDYGTTHTITTSWARYSGKISATGSTDALSFVFGNTTSTVSFALLKLEIGTVATAWCPHPSEQEAKGLLRVTTAPTAYTTTTGGFTPAFRMSLSTVRSESAVQNISIGDVIAYSYNIYKIGYIDDSYVYMAAAVSIRGSRAPRYLGSVAQSNPTTTNPTFSGVTTINGDWYLNTSDGKVYLRTANNAWTAQSTTAPNQYHLACINDMVSLLGTTTSSTVKANLETICNAYIERLLVGTAFINNMFARFITMPLCSTEVLSIGTTYTKGSIVSELGEDKYYQCKKDHTFDSWSLLDNTEYWEVINKDGIFNTENYEEVAKSNQNIDDIIGFKMGVYSKLNGSVYKFLGMLNIANIIANSLRSNRLTTQDISSYYGDYPEWVSGTAYSIGDIVFRAGYKSKQSDTSTRIYICIKAHTSTSSITITNTTYWKKIDMPRTFIDADGVSIKRGNYTGEAVDSGDFTMRLYTKTAATAQSPRAYVETNDGLYVVDRSVGTTLNKVLTEDDIWVE